MWLLAAVSAYFINAGVFVADKFLLSKKIHSSITYAFYVGIWSVFNFVILIFAPYLPNFKWLMIELAAGGLFLFTMVYWYKALHQSEATRVVPIVGSLIPIFSLLLSFFFLSEGVSEQQFLAFSVLIIGGGMISVKQTKLYFPGKVVARIRNILGKIHARYRPTQRLLVNSIASAFLFSSYYVLMKYIYSHQPFIGSFVWSRLGTFIGVIMIFLIPAWRRPIIEHQRGVKTKKNIAFFLTIRLLAAAAFIMLNWAISLGSVAMVNVLQGTQYLFLIAIVLILSVRFPRVLKEELGKDVLLQKIAGVVLVSLGLYILLV